MSQLRYWDSSVFLGLLKNEPDKVGKCQGVMRAAESGGVQIVTSAIALIEVIKLDRTTEIPREAEEKIRRFFDQDYIEVREVDQRIGEMARDLIWNHNLRPRDSIHVSTALEYSVASLDTFDDDHMTPLDGLLGDPPLRIGHPNLPVQERLPGT